MRLVGIANRNLRQRALTSALTTCSILLGTGIVAFLWLVATQADRKYRASVRGFDVILGPRESSSLDLVLSTIYLVAPSQGVVPFGVYREVHGDRPEARRRWGRFVRCAVPLAFGDSYRGFPIIGTTDAWFLRFGNLDADNAPRKLRFAAGRPFRFSHDDLVAEAEHQAELARGDGDGDDHAIPERWREVVIGAEVAGKLGLRLGSVIVPAHGIGATLHDHDEAACRVVGILERRDDPIDRAIYLPLGAFYRMSEHAAISSVRGDPDPDHVDLSAIVVNTRRSRLGVFQLLSEFRRRPDAQAVDPHAEVAKLFAVVGNVALALRVISYLVLVVGALGVFIALYNTMGERRRDVAIMRSLGARRAQIFTIVFLEAILITTTGAVLGVLAAHGVGFVLRDWLLERTGVPMSGAGFAWEELWLILGVSALGAVAGLLPAWEASRTDVAAHLSPDR